MIGGKTVKIREQKIADAGLTEEYAFLSRMQSSCQEGLISESEYNSAAMSMNSRLAEIGISGLCYVKNGKLSTTL